MGFAGLEIFQVIHAGRVEAARVVGCGEVVLQLAFARVAKVVVEDKLAFGRGRRSASDGGQQGQGGSTQVQQGQTNLPGAAGPAQVPYQENLPAYQRAAGEALDQSDIPPHLKDYVRDYFSNLEPKR
ncbi:hypothetical protein SE17_36055 [Kouleothrix aurantiaca]|uniref:Uncharacterized protein n=1 Tax=Kouleothrix aurantiaca TaxID=186479 RepID=A0A0P9D8E7_9CHLR|nr:hypothetical protein SE17_36055 [Kouleothrix aurantiaca]